MQSYITPKELAATMQVTTQTVRNWIKAGTIKQSEIIYPNGKGKGRPIRLISSVVYRLAGSQAKAIPIVDDSTNRRFRKSARERLNVRNNSSS